MPKYLGGPIDGYEDTSNWGCRSLWLYKETRDRYMCYNGFCVCPYWTTVHEGSIADGIYRKVGSTNTYRWSAEDPVYAESGLWMDTLHHSGDMPEGHATAVAVEEKPKTKAKPRSRRVQKKEE